MRVISVSVVILACLWPAMVRADGIDVPALVTHVCRSADVRIQKRKADAAQKAKAAAPGNAKAAKQAADAATADVQPYFDRLCSDGYEERWRQYGQDQRSQLAAASGISASAAANSLPRQYILQIAGNDNLCTDLNNLAEKASSEDIMVGQLCQPSDSGDFRSDSAASVAIDVIQGLIKSVFFGFLVSLIGCYQGFNATGGGRGVGMGTTRAVVIASVSTLIVDYFLTDILLALFHTSHG